MHDSSGKTGHPKDYGINTKQSHKAIFYSVSFWSAKTPVSLRLQMHVILFFLLRQGLSFCWLDATRFFIDVCRPPPSYRCVRSVNCTSLAHSVGSLPAISSFLQLPRRQHPGATHRASREAASLRFFAHRTDPRFAGKKVFVIRRQQAIMPNHCSSSNTSVYKLLWYCCTCNALWVLRFAMQFVMLLAVPPHSSRQLLCPSRHFIHSFLRSASLHHVRSQAICCKAGHPKPSTQSNTHGNAPAFS